MATSVDESKQSDNGKCLDATGPSSISPADSVKVALLRESTALVRISENTSFPAEMSSSTMEHGLASNLFKGWEESWVLEIAVLCFGCSAFASVGILLSFYSGRRLDVWTFSVSLSTIISTLSTASRLSLVFVLGACLGQAKWNWFHRNEESLAVFVLHEEAAKGPWGSLKLIWWAKFRHRITFGAFLIVVLLGLDPVLQATVLFPILEKSSKLAAQIGATTKLNIGIAEPLTGVDAQSIIEVPGTEEFLTTDFRATRPDSGLPAAISAALSPNPLASNFQPSFLCGTENCTWSAFTSLAVCSRCEDISSHIKTRRYEGKHPATVVASVVPFTEHSVPALGLVLSNMDGWYREKADADYVMLDTMSRSAVNPGRTLSFRLLDTVLLSTAYIKADQSWTRNETLWEDTDVIAGECVLYLCTNLYNSVVSNQVLDEVILGTWSNRDAGSYQLTQPNAEFTVPFDKYLTFSLYDTRVENGFASRTDLHLTIPPEASKFGKVQTDFSISQTTIATSIAWLIEYTGITDSSDVANSENVTDSDNATGFGSKPSRVYDGVIEESTNVTDLFDKMAASMTRWIRDKSLEKEPVQGTAFFSEPYIKVRWPLFAVPATVEMLAIVFTLMTIFETRRAGMRIWKSSSLAVHVHGLEPKLQQEMKRADGEGRMSAVAQEKLVRFKGEEIGLGSSGDSSGSRA